jgi:DNA polymerase-3 subunit gamma/tau
MRQSPPTADVNLADMAQRLEAALRRPARTSEPRDAGSRQGPRQAPASREPASPAREPAPTSHEVAAPNREQAAPEPPATAPETTPETTPEPQPAAAPEANAEPEPKPEAAEAKPAPAKSVFDSLEEEMANLLGRPPNKS